MYIEKCKWLDDADSVVMLMIDDFCNTWVDNNGNSKVDFGEDWGHHSEGNGGMWRFLNENLLKQFPYVKVTLFTVVGKREPIIQCNKKIYAESILGDEKFLEFIKKLSHNNNIELSYHGKTHGKVGLTRERFIEEWQTYKDIDEALSTIKEGKTIFYEAVGYYPEGGKYCGYKFNEFSDDSISKSGFKWWCRHWDAELEKDSQKKDLNYELELFEGVVDIPSTIDGSYYSIRAINRIFTKKYLKSLYLKIRYGKSIEKLIDERIKSRQIISIQEHTAAYRADERIQYPNVFSDMTNLKIIFNYLKKYNLWYATGSEIADYFLCYKFVNIINQTDKSFSISNDEKFNGKLITLKIKISYNISSEFITVNNGKDTYLFRLKDSYYVGTVEIINNAEYLINY